MNATEEVQEVKEVKEVQEKKEAPVLEKKGTTARKRAARARLTRCIAGVDTSLADVLKWSQEGREIYFGDLKDFLELSEETYAALNASSKQRYNLAKSITYGSDPVGAIMDAQRGWSKEYNIKPGSASSNTVVLGKDPNKDYYLSREDSVDFHANNEGFVVTRDPNITVGNSKETCTYKTVGGQRKPELILMERPKELAILAQKKSKDLRDRLTKAAQENYVESNARKGYTVTSNT